MKKIIQIDKCVSCPYFNRLLGKDYKTVFNTPYVIEYV